MSGFFLAWAAHWRSLPWRPLVAEAMEESALTHRSRIAEVPELGRAIRNDAWSAHRLGLAAGGCLASGRRWTLCPYKLLPGF